MGVPSVNRGVFAKIIASTSCGHNSMKSREQMFHFAPSFFMLIVFVVVVLLSTEPVAAAVVRWNHSSNEESLLLFLSALLFPRMVLKEDNDGDGDGR